MSTADLLTVTTLAENDRDRWQELFAGYNAFYGRTLPPPAYDNLWEALMSDGEIHGFGGRVGDRLVGIAHFLRHPSTTAADVCYLQDLFTDAEHRGKGVARALIHEITRWATSGGCSRVYWNTQADNATARHLYDRVAVHRGFIRYDIDL